VTSLACCMHYSTWSIIHSYLFGTRCATDTIHANHYNFGIISTLLKSKLHHYDHNCNITLLYIAECTQIYWFCQMLLQFWTCSLWRMLCLWSTDILYCHWKKNCWYFETKSVHNHSHQRPSVKLKMHQNKSQLGLGSWPHWGSLQLIPDPIAEL